MVSHCFWLSLVTFEEYLGPFCSTWSEHEVWAALEGCHWSPWWLHWLMARVYFSGRRSLEKVGKSATVPCASSRREKESKPAKSNRGEEAREQCKSFLGKSHKQHHWSWGARKPLQRINCLREGIGMKPRRQRARWDKLPQLRLQTKNRVLARIEPEAVVHLERHIWVEGEKNKLPSKIALWGS